MPDNQPYPSENEKQCRICFEGQDADMGRLIRPCLCRGTISYVHVKCLQLWRNTSTSKSAFYACPQCHYRYAFARTRALGLASNHIFVGALAAILFAVLAFGASFVATFFIDMVDEPDSERDFYYYTFFVSPYEIFKDLFKLIYRVLLDQDILVDDEASRGHYKGGIRPKSTSGVLGRFFGRLLLGLPVIGIASFIQLVWSTSMLGTLQFFTRRGARNMNRRERSRDIAAILLMIAVAGGAIRAIWSVYKLTERFSRWILLRAEDVILEVN